MEIYIAPNKLDVAVEAYLEAEELGKPLDQKIWLERFPILAEYFSDLNALKFGHSRVTADPPGFRLVRVLGTGGMGRVWEAVDEKASRTVALKLLADPAAMRQDARRLRLEAKAVAQLEHPNIVPLYSVGEFDGRPYFTMRFFPGGTLAERLETIKSDPKQVASLVSYVARAVHFAHQRGVLHRDIKPSNILVEVKADGTLNPFVADFGLANGTDGSKSRNRRGFSGTPQYMSPDSVQGLPPTVATDVWGIGATLYAAMTGSPPFFAEHPLALMKMICQSDPVPPSTKNKSIASELCRICLKCIEKDPAHRYESANAIADDLDNWLAGRPVTALPLGVTGRVRNWTARNPIHTALVATVVLGFIAVTATELSYNEKLRVRNQQLVVALDEMKQTTIMAEAKSIQARAASEYGMQPLSVGRSAVSTFYELAIKDEAFQKPDALQTRMRLLETVLEYYEKEIIDRTNAPEQLKVADAHNGLAEVYLADALRGAGRVAFLRNQLPEARKYLDDAIAVYESINAQDDASPPYLCQAYASALSYLGDVLLKQENRLGAINAFRESITRNIRMSSQYPDSPDIVYGMIVAKTKLADALQVAGEDAGCDELIKQLPNDLKRLPEDFVDSMFVKYRVDQYRADKELALGHFSEALNAYLAAIDKAPESMWPLLHSKEAICLASTGQVARASSVAKNFSEATCCKTLFNLACALSIAAGASVNDPAAKEVLALDAVSFLGKAIEAGYQFKKPASDHSMLEAIRNRNDFQSIFSNLEKL